MDTNTIVLALALGVVAGLRSTVAPTAVAWAARCGWLDLQNTSLGFLGNAVVPFVLTALMLAELVADKLPKTPSRTTPGPFIGRIAMGGFAGAALAAGLGGSLVAGAVAGALGAVAGTLGGYRARTGLVRALKVPDIVIALAEDAVAIGAGLLVVSRGF